MYTRCFVQWNGLGGVVHGGGEDFRMGSVRGPGRGVARGRNPGHVHWNFCSPATVLEEPPWMSEGRVGVGTSRVQDPRTWRRPRIAEGGSRNGRDRSDSPAVGP